MTTPIEKQMGGVGFLDKVTKRDFYFKIVFSWC